MTYRVETAPDRRTDAPPGCFTAFIYEDEAVVAVVRERPSEDDARKAGELVAGVMRKRWG